MRKNAKNDFQAKNDSNQNFDRLQKASQGVERDKIRGDLHTRKELVLERKISKVSIFPSSANQLESKGSKHSEILTVDEIELQKYINRSSDLETSRNYEEDYTADGNENETACFKQSSKLSSSDQYSLNNRHLFQNDDMSQIKTSEMSLATEDEALSPLPSKLIQCYSDSKVRSDQLSCRETNPKFTLLKPAGTFSSHYVAKNDRIVIEGKTEREQKEHFSSLETSFAKKAQPKNLFMDFNQSWGNQQHRSADRMAVGGEGYGEDDDRSCLPSNLKLTIKKDEEVVGDLEPGLKVFDGGRDQGRNDRSREQSLGRGSLPFQRSLMPTKVSTSPKFTSSSRDEKKLVDKSTQTESNIKPKSKDQPFYQGSDPEVRRIDVKNLNLICCLCKNKIQEETNRAKGPTEEFKEASSTGLGKFSPEVEALAERRSFEPERLICEESELESPITTKDKTQKTAQAVVPEDQNSSSLEKKSGISAQKNTLEFISSSMRQTSSGRDQNSPKLRESIQQSSRQKTARKSIHKIHRLEEIVKKVEIDILRVQKYLNTLKRRAWELRHFIKIGSTNLQNEENGPKFTNLDKLEKSVSLLDPNKSPHIRPGCGNIGQNQKLEAAKGLEETLILTQIENPSTTHLVELDPRQLISIERSLLNKTDRLFQNQPKNHQTLYANSKSLDLRTIYQLKPTASTKRTPNTTKISPYQENFQWLKKLNLLPKNYKKLSKLNPPRRRAAKKMAKTRRLVVPPCKTRKKVVRRWDSSFIKTVENISNIILNDPDLVNTLPVCGRKVDFCEVGGGVDGRLRTVSNRRSRFRISRARKGKGRLKKKMSEWDVWCDKAVSLDLGANEFCS